MHFSPYITILDCETNKRVSLEQKSYIKYFGVLIDQNYSRKKRINWFYYKDKEDNRNDCKADRSTLFLYCSYKYL